MFRSGGQKTLPRPLREVEAYWEALRQSGDIPTKSQISPPGLEESLPYVMLIERLAPCVSRFRFGGQAIHDLLGMSADRVPLTVLFSASCQRALANAVEDVFAKPAILRVELDSKGGIGRPSLSGQMLIMPLRSETGTISHAFGALHYEGRLGRVPRQFTDIRLKSTRLILNNNHGATQTEPVNAYEPAQATFHHKEYGRPAFAKRPRLRVIQGDKR